MATENTQIVKSTENHGPAMPDMREKAVESFVNMMSQFLESLSEVFPNCLKVNGYHLAWSARFNTISDKQTFMEVGTEALESYHDSMAPFYDQCSQRDNSILYEDIDIMNNIDLKQKWEDGMHPQTEQAIWDYIEKLNEFSNLYATYSSVPVGIVSTLQSMSQGLASQIQNGEMSLSDLNPLALAQQIRENVNASDIQQLAETAQTQGLGNTHLLMSLGSSMMSQFTQDRESQG